MISICSATTLGKKSEYFIIIFYSMCNRLVTISWNDWSSDVRVVAAQALGRTGQTKVKEILIYYYM